MYLTTTTHLSLGLHAMSKGVADAFWDGLGLHPWDREEFWKEETYR